jgi:aminoglycoside phosphotransferase (APT) family kinase protein
MKHVEHHPRQSIYYWKCDRPAALHGTEEGFNRDQGRDQLLAVLQDSFSGKPIELRPAGGQGNHVTWFAAIDGADFFVRIEDGPERDDYMEVEACVLAEVRALGIPAPQVHAMDTSRRRVPFAWQVMDVVPYPDLNQLYKEGRLDLGSVAEQIGAAVARWQGVRPRGFGPFDPDVARRDGRLEGFHRRYEDYFMLQLDRHLRFLAESDFLKAAEVGDIHGEILRHRPLLALDGGCLVHKDLALWNILGTQQHIAAFIDWDDAIAGDPMDDLSLLGCFYDGPILARALAGYASVRPVPPESRRRFWLHLLRNMIVKACIRVGAGYFDRTDSFFLIGAGGSGADLKTFTHQRLAAALRGLREDQPIESL